MHITRIILLPYIVAKKCYKFIYDIFILKMPLDEFENYDEYWKKRSEISVRYRDKYIASMLPDTGRVLDIGCGNGAFLKYLKSKKLGLELMGIDISDVAISRLKKEGIAGIVCDLTKEDMPPSVKADHVTLMEVLEHVANAEELIQKIRRTGAMRFYVTIPNLGFFKNRLRLAFGGKMPITMIFFHIKEHIRFWTVSDFKYWADRMGFKIVHYHGQYGTFFLWKVWPSLFASGMIYVLEDKKQAN